MLALSALLANSNAKASAIACVVVSTMDVLIESGYSQFRGPPFIPMRAAQSHMKSKITDKYP